MSNPVKGTVIEISYPIFTKSTSGEHVSVFKLPSADVLEIVDIAPSMFMIIAENVIANMFDSTYVDSNDIVVITIDGVGTRVSDDCEELSIYININIGDHPTDVAIKYSDEEMPIDEALNMWVSNVLHELDNTFVINDSLTIYV